MMRIKTLHFHKVSGILSEYEEATAGCITVRIWKQTKNKDDITSSAFKIVLDTEGEQLDSDLVCTATFEDVEENRREEVTHAHVLWRAQQMFEDYIEKFFLDGLENQE